MDNQNLDIPPIQPPPAPNHPGQQPPSLDNQEKQYSGLVIAGYILSFVSALSFVLIAGSMLSIVGGLVLGTVGLVLSIIGLKDCKKNNKRGRGLAIACISSLAIVLPLFILLVLLLNLSSL